MQIHSTKDYKQFKIIACNREIDDAHVKKLIAAISEKNLLHLNPIIVNENLEVIDGQHRLKAAKVLRVEIHYQISEGVNFNDISTLNTNKKNWSPKDYLRFYVEQRITDYLRIEAFLEKFPKIPLTPVLQMLSPAPKNVLVSFKEGVFKVTNWNEATAVAEHLEQLSQGYDFVYVTGFIRAFNMVCRTKDFDYNRFIAQLAKQPRSLVPCVDKNQYMEMFAEIYNYEYQQHKRLYF